MAETPKSTPERHIQGSLVEHAGHLATAGSLPPVSSGGDRATDKPEASAAPNPLRESFLRHVAPRRGDPMSTPDTRPTPAPSSVTEARPTPPADYDLPPKALKAVKARQEAENHEPFDDPDKVLFPGLVLTNPDDPAHRRMITNMFRNRRGLPMVAVHIEGQDGVRNMPLDEVKARLKAGSLKTS